MLSRQKEKKLLTSFVCFLLPSFWKLGTTNNPEKDKTKKRCFFLKGKCSLFWQQANFALPFLFHLSPPPKKIFFGGVPKFFTTRFIAETLKYFVGTPPPKFFLGGVDLNDTKRVNKMSRVLSFESKLCKSRSCFSFSLCKPNESTLSLAFSTRSFQKTSFCFLDKVHLTNLLGKRSLFFFPLAKTKDFVV